MLRVVAGKRVYHTAASYCEGEFRDVALYSNDPVTPPTIVYVAVTWCGRRYMRTKKPPAQSLYHRPLCQRCETLRRKYTHVRS